MSFVVNWKTHLKSYIICFLAAIIFQKPFENIIVNFFENELILYPSSNLIVNFYFNIILLMIPISVIHELIHGITFKLFGGKVTYGFKWIYAYTREVSGKEIKRNMFLIVLLMPLTVISLICFILNTKLCGVIFFINMLGSSGDIYMGITLGKLKNNSFIIDRPYGYDVVIK